MQFASRRAFFYAAAAAAVLAVPAHAADGPAAQLIEKVAGEVIELIKTTQGAQREAGIRSVLERYFDLTYMGRAALATHWDGTTPAQRDRFLKAAISAEARAYAERFGQYGGQTLATPASRTGPTASSSSPASSTRATASRSPSSGRSAIRARACGSPT